MGLEAGQGRTGTAAANALDRDWLKQVAEEIKSGFPRPFSRSEVVLVDIDPGRLFAFWNIPLAAYQEAVAAHHLAAGSPEPLLRLTRIGRDAVATAEDIPVGGLQSRVYLQAGPPGSVYQAEIGFAQADGGFVPLAVSNPAALPFPPPALPGPVALGVKSPRAAPWRSPQASFEAIDALAVYAAVPEAVANAATLGLNGGTAPPANHGETSPAPEEFPPPPGAGETFTPPSIAAPNSRQAAPGETTGGGVSAQETAGARAELRPVDGNLVVDPETLTEQPLALETVLPLSSFVFSEGEGGVDVALEIVAEVHLHGRAKPGTRLELFGEPIPLRPDGTFWIRRLLPRDPALLNALFASRDGWGRVDG